MPSAEPKLAALLSALDDPQYLERFAPRVTEVGSIPAADASAPSARDLARDGFTRISGATEEEEAAALVETIEALRSASLPPLFAYSFDETWRIGDRVATILSATLGAAYDVMPDVWAFRIAVGSAHRGWEAHRGSYQLAPDRSAPDLLNVWIALTDATTDNSCMYVVPLGDDAAYPDELESHAASATKGAPLPVPAGSALVWNANLLHWGGPSSERATAPRISITFTLGKRGSQRSPAVAPSTHHERLDLLARQVVVYAAAERGFPDLVRRWAELRLAVVDVAKRQRETRGRKAP